MEQTTAVPSGKRARNRLARHSDYLQTALRIATEHGLEALTMQRLADEVDAAIGTVYTYFPSKGALLAEVQREAVDRILGSYLLLRPDVEARVADSDPTVAALTHLVAFGRFWIDSLDTYPQEQHLLQQLMNDTRRVVPDDELGRVLPAILRLVDLGRERFEAATATGALTDGDPMDRTITLAAALSGVLGVSKLDRWDVDLLDGRRLARALVDDLLRGWGASSDGLAAAHVVLDAIARQHPLARPLPDRET
ncbi:MAG TPA: helix-turn-helix domain-containing protein [Acidimicrobiales bacterium]|nr:helix-turn-helix domain-containing protein [Acidimicrobiales bacterium]